MRTIAKLNVLLREQIELPEGMKLATDEFHEGWKIVCSGDVARLKEKIQAQGGTSSGLGWVAEERSGGYIARSY